LLRTKNLTDFGFRTICSIRTKALVETRIEHAEGGWTLGRIAKLVYPIVDVTNIANGCEAVATRSSP